MNKHQLERVVIKWLNKNFGNLTPKKHKDYPKSVFYVNSDNGFIMEYNKKNEYVYIHNDQIWSIIQSLFNLNYGETQSIIKAWLEETYKLGVVAPFFRNISYFSLLEETYK
jgi:hypothetical protein